MEIIGEKDNTWNLELNKWNDKWIFYVYLKWIKQLNNYAYNNISEKLIGNETEKDFVFKEKRYLKYPNYLFILSDVGFFLIINIFISEEKSKIILMIITKKDSKLWLREIIWVILLGKESQKLCHLSHKKDSLRLQRRDVNNLTQIKLSYWK